LKLLLLYLKAAVTVFPLCCYLCLKSAIAVICGIINLTRVALQHHTEHNV